MGVINTRLRNTGVPGIEVIRRLYPIPDEQVRRRQECAGIAAGYLAGKGNHSAAAMRDCYLSNGHYKVWLCGRQACPVCHGMRIRRFKRPVVARIPGMHLPAGAHFVFATLTVPNCEARAAEVRARLDLIDDAWKPMNRRRVFSRALAAVCSKEITAGDPGKRQDIFHPHAHCIWIFESCELAEDAASAVADHFQQAAGCGFATDARTYPVGDRELLAYITNYCLKLPDINDLERIVSREDVYLAYYEALNRVSGQKQHHLVSLRGEFSGGRRGISETETRKMTCTDKADAVVAPRPICLNSAESDTGTPEVADAAATSDRHAEVADVESRQDDRPGGPSPLFGFAAVQPRLWRPFQTLAASHAPFPGSSCHDVQPAASPFMNREARAGAAAPAAGALQGRNVASMMPADVPGGMRAGSPFIRPAAAGGGVRSWLTAAWSGGLRAALKRGIPIAPDREGSSNDRENGSKERKDGSKNQEGGPNDRENAAARSGDERAIREAIATWQQGVEHCEPRTATEHYFADATWISAQGVTVSGRAAVEAHLRQVLAKRQARIIRTIASTASVTFVRHDMAVADSSRRVSVHNPRSGAERFARLRDLRVFSKQDGKWVIVGHCTTCDEERPLPGEGAA